MTALLQNNDRSLCRDVLLTLTILAVSAFLRFWGLKWGLPNNLHEYSYHPDEFLTIGAAFAIAYLGHFWNPSFYNYPSLYLYLSAAAIVACTSVVRAQLSPALVYLCGRCVSAAMGTLAVVAVSWAGSVLYDKRVGLLAGTILCVAPLHVQHSHFATVDVPSTLFIALALGFAGSIYRHGHTKDYILAGLMAGFAAGTKYNAGLVVLSPIAAHFLRSDLRGSYSRLRGLVVIGVSAIAAFIFSTPGCLLDTQRFIHGLHYELLHSASGHGLVFAGTGNGFTYTFWHSLVPGLGIALACLFVISLVAAAIARDRSALTIGAFVLPYLVAISASQVRFARYILPLLPGIAILVAWTVVAGRDKLCNTGLLRKLGRASLLTLCSIGVVIALITSLSLNLALSSEDPRDKAARWIFANIPKGATIGVIDWPWFYSPPYSKWAGFGTLPQRQKAAKKTPYDLKVLLSRPDVWQPLPKWVVISDYEVEDALRLADCDKLPYHQRKQVALINRAVNILRKKYTCRAVFGGSVGMINWNKLPHDMRYTSPRIMIHKLCD